MVTKMLPCLIGVLVNKKQPEQALKKLDEKVAAVWYVFHRSISKFYSWLFV